MNRALPTGRKYDLDRSDAPGKEVTVRGGQGLVRSGIPSAVNAPQSRSTRGGGGAAELRSGLLPRERQSTLSVFSAADPPEGVWSTAFGLSVQSNALARELAAARLARPFRPTQQTLAQGHEASRRALQARGREGRWLQYFVANSRNFKGGQSLTLSPQADTFCLHVNDPSTSNNRQELNAQETSIGISHWVQVIRDHLAQEIPAKKAGRVQVVHYAGAQRHAQLLARLQALQRRGTLAVTEIQDLLPKGHQQHSNGFLLRIKAPPAGGLGVCLA